MYEKGDCYNDGYDDGDAMMATVKLFFSFSICQVMIREAPTLWRDFY